MTLRLIDDAMAAGARLAPAAKLLGLSARTVQRWRDRPEDARHGPKSRPPNALSPAERLEVLDMVNSPENRNLSPRQIVPRMADQGVYLASESTIYRVLRSEGQLAHRSRSKPASVQRPKAHRATGPNQVWSWDITYLRSSVRGSFFYLYMILDVWSRKIVGSCVDVCECSDTGEELFKSTCSRLGVDPSTIVLHSDNGSPMKGIQTMLTSLGVTPSFSRPGVSDDNSFSESLFRTLKYRPGYPSFFTSRESAEEWVGQFVDWYNTTHLHSGIRFVTPDDRHAGHDQEILAHRSRVYEEARRRNPRRWSKSTRNWTPIEEVYLNPEKRMP
jgi:transposase InsO family protein